MHKVAFAQLGSLLLDIPFAFCLLLTLVVPWRAALCAREVRPAAVATLYFKLCTL